MSTFEIHFIMVLVPVPLRFVITVNYVPVPQH